MIFLKEIIFRKNIVKGVIVKKINEKNGKLIVL
jgi:hypothetical protein